jgi:hypothetical protein
MARTRQRDRRLNHARTRERDPVKALLTDGPLQGKPVEVEPVEGRPPATIDLQDEEDGTLRYCLSELNQEGMTAAYTFLYAV